MQGSHPLTAQACWGQGSHLAKVLEGWWDWVPLALSSVTLQGLVWQEPCLSLVL